MLRALLVGLALGFGLALVAVPGKAEAGPVWRGDLLVVDGGTICNRTTGVPFLAEPTKKFVVQCDQASLVGTDVNGCDAGKCIKVIADEKLPVQINSTMNLSGNGFNADGGVTVVTYDGGWLCNAPVTGSVSICHVYSCPLCPVFE